MRQPFDHPRRFEVHKDSVVIGCAGRCQHADDVHLERVGARDTKHVIGYREHRIARRDAGQACGSSAQDTLAEHVERSALVELQSAKGKVIQRRSDDRAVRRMKANVQRNHARQF